MRVTDASGEKKTWADPAVESARRALNFASERYRLPIEITADGSIFIDRDGWMLSKQDRPLAKLGRIVGDRIDGTRGNVLRVDADGTVHGWNEPTAPRFGANDEIGGRAWAWSLADDGTFTARSGQRLGKVRTIKLQGYRPQNRRVLLLTFLLDFLTRPGAAGIVFTPGLVVPQGGKQAPLEIQKDGLVVVGGERAARIVGTHIDDPNGKIILWVDTRGNIIGPAEALRFDPDPKRFDADDAIVGASGRISLRDADATLTLTRSPPSAPGAVPRPPIVESIKLVGYKPENRRALLLLFVAFQISKPEVRAVTVPAPRSP
jgi:hypothetical protein